MKIEIPEHVMSIIALLERSGHQVYIVGGCVRDALLNRVPHDWDIATSARPEEIKMALADIPVLDTGIKHGTVTAIVDHEPFEITTFRTEGSYSDGRHPDQVTFVTDIREDLSRRDFTINAMAYHPVYGLVDPFDGASDCKRKLIRCVGNPEDRFNEDALRMMRAVRFAAQFGFSIDEATWNAAKESVYLLGKISMERIQAELMKIMQTEAPHKFLDQYQELFDYIVPEFLSMHDCEQNNPYHVYDIWRHTMKVLENVEYASADPIVRMAALFHDISKPQCKERGTDGYDHFHGHAEEGTKIVRMILRRLKFDNKTIYQVAQLVEWHDKTFSCKKNQVKRWMNELGEEQLQRLFILRRADILGQDLRFAKERLEKVDVMESLMKEILEEHQCFQLKDMAINGSDLIRIGVPEGKQIGQILHSLFELVLMEQCENERDVLIEQAKNMLKAS